MDALNVERQRAMTGSVTTESVVQSTTSVNQRSIEATKASSTDQRPKSGAIVRSIACIHQHFEDVTKTSQSMQKPHSDIAGLTRKIQIQQVAFNNGCKLLLVTSAVSRQDVDSMIEHPDHPIWKDTVAHRNLDIVMAHFYHLCLEALEHFQKSLSKLKLGLDGLRGQPKKKWTRRYQLWLNMSSSPALGATEDLPKLVQNLRNYNDIFCTLISQAVSRRSDYKFRSSFGGDLDCAHAMRAPRAPHHHTGCIQQASQVLYDALSNVWTCREHEEHSLNISLDFDYPKAGAICRGGDLRFHVAVTSPDFDGLYRLVADTSHSEFCIYRTVEEDRLSKNTHLENRVAEPATWTKASEFDAAASRPASFIRPELLQDRMADSGLKEDLCYWLRKSSVTIEPKQETGCPCLGWLEIRSGRRFLLSYVLGDENRKQGSHSLDDILAHANNERRAIPLEERLRTALLLAAGVLHLNSSSWLRQVWSSKDIHFFDIDSCEKCALGEPFLQVHLDSNTTREPVHDLKSPAASHSCLLSLGVVLIELAFSAPWRKLQLQENITKNLLEWERDYLNLMRLSDTVSRELGSRYAKVVETCLFQGLGAKETNGLGQAELDELISEDIVRELDRCLSAVTSSYGGLSARSYSLQ